MSQVRLISFATPSFILSKLLLTISARRHGADTVKVYDQSAWKGTDFESKFSAVLSQPKGFGYYLWKSFLIQRELERCSENDVVIYCDSGIEILKSLTPLVEIAKSQAEPVIVSDFQRFNREWTKRECFAVMGCDDDKFHQGPQVVGGFNLWRNTPIAHEILRNWMEYGGDIRCNTDAPSAVAYQELPEFKGNRHDQSILSLLTMKFNLPIYRDPAQYGEGLINGSLKNQTSVNMAESPYPTSMEVHRLRNKQPKQILELVRRICAQKLGARG